MTSEFQRNRHKHRSEKELTVEILCTLERIYDLLDRRLPLPRIVGIVVSWSNEMKTLTVSATWSDGHTGFDDTHVQPADWEIGFSDTAGEVTKTGADTATVDGPNADTVTAAYGGFTATYEFVAPAAVITGLSISDA